MAALDIITLADFKGYKPSVGEARDVPWGRIITSASRMIEAELDRRVVYRAPPTSETAVLSAATWTATSSTAFPTQPNSAGRTLIVTFTSATAGTLTVVGTVGGVSKTVVFDAANGLVQHGLDFFTALATYVIASATGSGTVTVTTSQGYLEYHSIRDGGHVLLPMEWPVASVPELNEDISRTYGTTTRLVANTDYILTTGGLSEPAVITRINGAFRRSWFGGWRSIKLVSSAGYTVANCPQEIKDVCRRLVNAMIEETENGHVNVSSWSGPMGSGTRFGAAGLTRILREQLAPYRRFRMGSDTGERDFDTEAA